jgi:cell division protein FtsB
MKKVLFFASIIVCIVIINGLLKSIYDLWNKQDLVVEAQHELKQVKVENNKLKQELSYVKSQEFVEAEARDKLFMVKPGESGVIIPEELKKTEKATPTPTPPNWKRWVDLFVKGN